MTSLEVWGLGVLGMVAMVLVSFVVSMLVMGWFLRFKWLCCVCSQTRLGPGPRQQGRQVQAVRKRGLQGQPKAGGSEYLELHGAFSIRCAAPGTEALSKSGDLAWPDSAGIALSCCRCLFFGVLRGVPAEEG